MEGAQTLFPSLAPFLQFVVKPISLSLLKGCHNMSCFIEWPEEYAAAANLLTKAANFADSLQRSQWEFAVEIADLAQAGLSRVDLRWLVCQGLIEHAIEQSDKPTGGRSFQVTRNLTFGNHTCFVLTATGLLAAGRIDSTCGARATSTMAAATAEKSLVSQPRTGNSLSGVGPAELATIKPFWDLSLRRLSLGDVLIKEYKTPAPNQHLVLCAFQEEGWPARIDDPLPPVPELEPKRRLHETISGLNRNQRNPVLRFGGDGCGCGVRWLRAEVGTRFDRNCTKRSPPDFRQIAAKSNIDG